MLLQIPTSPDTPFYSQVSQLEGVDYGFVFVYNQRENCYYLTLEDVAGNPIVKGIRLVCNVGLTRHYHRNNLPPGELFIFSSESDNQSPPGLGELGTRCQLTYVTSDDSSLVGLD